MCGLKDTPAFLKLRTFVGCKDQATLLPSRLRRLEGEAATFITRFETPLLSAFVEIIKHFQALPGDSPEFPDRASSSWRPVYTGDLRQGSFQAGKSGAIGREVKLDFVLPGRYKNLERGGKRGQTSSSAERFDIPASLQPLDSRLTIPPPRRGSFNRAFNFF